MTEQIKTIISYRKDTPRWAKNTYKVVFAITTALTAWVAATNMFPQHVKYELILVLKFIDPVAYAVFNMFGVSRYGKETK